MPGDRRLESGAEDRVDDDRALRDLGEVQLPALLVGDLHDRHAETAEDVEVRARVTAHVGQRADHEHRRVDPVLEQRPGDDEAVAAVVAAAAQDRHAAVQLRFVGGFDGRDDLPAGVLHQHERRDPDLVDGVSIGFAHLRGSQDSHGQYALAVCGGSGVRPATAYCLLQTSPISSIGGQEQNRFRSPYGVVDASDRGPVLPLAHERQRKRGLLARVGVRPLRRRDRPPPCAGRS